MKSKLVYILGAGHSGTTLLDCVLGTLPGVVSMGEVTHLPWQLHRGKNAPERVSVEEAKERRDVCSCLRNFRACPFWAPIINEMSEELGFDVFEDSGRFKIMLLNEEFRDLEHRVFSMPRFRRIFSWAPRRVLIRLGERYPILSPISSLIRNGQQDRVTNNWMLFDRVAAYAQAECVVDSSKDPIRFKLLSERRPDRVKAVLMARSLHACAVSYLRRGHNPLEIARHARSYHNRAVGILERAGVEYTVLSYDQLALDPMAQRRRLAEFLGIEAPEESIYLDTHACHLVAGNPMRFRGKMDIRYDARWVNEITPSLRARIDEIEKTVNPLVRDLLRQEKGAIMRAASSPEMEKGRNENG
jgi:hypothetical protein